MKKFPQNKKKLSVCLSKESKKMLKKSFIGLATWAMILNSIWDAGALNNHYSHINWAGAGGAFNETTYYPYAYWHNNSSIGGHASGYSVGAHQSGYAVGAHQSGYAISGHQNGIAAWAHQSGYAAWAHQNGIAASTHQSGYASASCPHVSGLVNGHLSNTGTPSYWAHQSGYAWAHQNGTLVWGHVSGYTGWHVNGGTLGGHQSWYALGAHQNGSVVWGHQNGTASVYQHSNHGNVHSSY